MITVTLNQTDADSGLDDTKTVYRLGKASGSYEIEQTSNEFTGLTEKNYYLQTTVVDKRGNAKDSIETVVNMYNGTISTENGVEVASESGGVFTTPYYRYAVVTNSSVRCPGSGKEYTGPYTCPNCGTKPGLNMNNSGDGYVFKVHYITTSTTSYSYGTNPGANSVTNTWYMK